MNIYLEKPLWLVTYAGNTVVQGILLILAYIVAKYYCPAVGLQLCVALVFINYEYSKHTSYKPEKIE